MRAARSCGIAQFVVRGSSGDGRESPTQLLELALLRAELGLGFCASPELPQLERQCLEPPNEAVELSASALRLGRAFCEHEILLSRLFGGATHTAAAPSCV
jgi:hypothetical protein